MKNSSGVCGIGFLFISLFRLQVLLRILRENLGKKHAPDKETDWNWSLLFFVFFYWSRVDLQYCVSFWYTGQWYFVIQLLGHVWHVVTPEIAAHQVSLSFTISWNLLKLMSIESVKPPNHLILCLPLLLPSNFPSIRVFYSESALHIMWPKYCSFSFSIIYIYTHTPLQILFPYRLLQNTE